MRSGTAKGRRSRNGWRRSPPRERQVLEGLVAGHPNKTIAHELGISSRTVEIYRANVMAKMQATSLSHLVRMALIAA
jgi:two-component system, LuxR family, response regulator FixJ